MARELSGFEAKVEEKIIDGHRTALISLDTYEKDEDKLLVAQDIISKYISLFMPLGVTGLVVANYNFDDEKEFLNYDEDSKADIDANFVITENMQLVEIQATGERKTFSDQDLSEMLKISKSAIKEIIQHQKSCFEK